MLQQLSSCQDIFVYSHTEARLSGNRTAYKRWRNGVTPAASPRTRRTIDASISLVKITQSTQFIMLSFDFTSKMSSIWLLILPWAQNKLDLWCQWK